MAGLLVALGETVSNGIVVPDTSLLHCTGRCWDAGGPIGAASGAQVYFFDDGLPVGRAAGNGRTMALPSGTNSIVAEKSFGLWTGREQVQHAPSRLAKPTRAEAAQIVDLQVDPEGAHFVVHVRLPRSDARARAYLDLGYGLASFVNRVTPLSIDGTSLVSARDLARDTIELTSSTFTMDVRGSLAEPGLAATWYGAHRVVIGGDAENPVDLNVSLRGETFAREHPFDRTPSVMTGLGATWHLARGDARTIWIEPSASVPVSQRLRTLLAPLFASAAYPLFLLLIGWQVIGILVTLRLGPFGARPSLVRAAFVMVATCAVVAFGLLSVGIASLVPYPAATLVVFVMALMAIGFVYAIATPRERRIVGTRPGAAIVALFLLQEVAGIAGAALLQSPNQYWLADSLLHLATYALASVVGLIALAPRLLVLAARVPARVGRVLYALATLAVLISAALWRPLYPGDDSHQGLPIAVGSPYAAGSEMLFDAFIIALPIVGFLALNCGARLDGRSTRRVAYAGIVVLLALWCIGLDGSLPVIPPALLGLVTIPLIALRSRAECEALAQHVPPPGTTGDVLLEQAVLRADLDVAARTRRHLREKFLGGEMDFATFTTRSADLTKFGSDESQRLLRGSLGGVTTLFTAFALQNPIRTARQAAYIGALLFGMTALIGFDELKDTLGASSLSAMLLGSWILHWVARGAVAAFVFAYFLPYLRGGMATTKGIFLSLAFVLAVAPAALLFETSQHALAALVIAALFFPVVGAILDSIGLLQHAESVSLMRLFSINFRSIAAIGTVFLSAIASAATGQLSQAAASLVAVATHSPAVVGRPLPRVP